MSQQPRKCVDALKAYQPGKSIEEVKATLGIDNIIKMASNENPLGCPVTLNELSDVLEKVHQYPHQESSLLRQKLLEKFNIEANELILGNGSDDIIQMLATAYLDHDSEVITSEHTFSVYAFVAKLFGGCVKQIPMKNWSYDLEEIISAVSKKTKIIFIANPNNPTGSFVTHDELDRFLSHLDPRVLLVLDEAYAEYADDVRFPNSLKLRKTYSNLIVLRTFSKLYGLAGLRVGYGIADPSVIEVLQKIRQPFNVNTLALNAAALALDKHDFLEESLSVNRRGKSFFYQALDELGLRFIPSEGNFVCIHIPGSADETQKKLMEKGIIIRSLTSFGLPESIRVTIGKDEENKRFIQSLKEVLEL